jgi:hypothetical protein
MIKLGNSETIQTMSYLVGVVLVHDPATGGINLLVALAGSAHAQSGVHVHIVAGHIQTNQSLEDDSPTGPGGTEEDQETRGCAAVSHHVQHRAEYGRLVEVASRIAVKRVQQTRHRVEERAGSRVEGHVV